MQTFLGSQWFKVRPFALARDSITNLYLDPGPPPYARGIGDAAFKSNNVAVLHYSSLLDPDAGLTIDVSPGGPGKNSILGTHDGYGHPTNPVTGSPYPSNVVSLADYGRVVAEMWADGPDSETPPGHWNVLAIEVSDQLRTKRIGGTGPEVTPLE